MVLGIEIGMKWSAEYNTGIEVIDDQHRRILDYINEIADLKYSHDRVKMKSVLDNIIDYTQSHFTLFIKKIETYRERFELGHEIDKELHEALSKWLINHIRHDDADYVGAVRENMVGIIKENEKKKGKNWFSRFFA